MKTHPDSAFSDPTFGRALHAELPQSLQSMTPTEVINHDPAAVAKAARRLSKTALAIAREMDGLARLKTYYESCTKTS